MIKKTFLFIALLTLFACSATVIPPAEVTGKIFPQVHGTSLSKKEVIIPDSFLGKTTLVIVGYQQKTQFDIDRWILGVLQADIHAEIVELPTIAGMMPEMVQGFITGGMRKGIPNEDWGTVVPIFEDADKIIKTFGNERPQSALVILLNKQGEVVWSSNRGYSPKQILELKKVVSHLSLEDKKTR